MKAHLILFTIVVVAVIVATIAMKKLNISSYDEDGIELTQ